MVPLLCFLLSSIGCAISCKLIPHTTVVYDRFLPDRIAIFPKYFSDVSIFLQILVASFYITQTELEKCLVILTINQVFRMITINLTVLPPLKTYDEKLRFNGLNGTGREYIYSGHACYACVSFIYLYGRVPTVPLVLYNLVSQSSVILSRNHYTIDVVLAWFITGLLYHCRLITM